MKFDFILSHPNMIQSLVIIKAPVPAKSQKLSNDEPAQ